jgi:hypothetical protein
MAAHEPYQGRLSVCLRPPSGGPLTTCVGPDSSIADCSWRWPSWPSSRRCFTDGKNGKGCPSHAAGATTAVPLFNTAHALSMAGSLPMNVRKQLASWYVRAADSRRRGNGIQQTGDSCRRSRAVDRISSGWGGMASHAVVFVVEYFARRSEIPDRSGWSLLGVPTRRPDSSVNLLCERF